DHPHVVPWYSAGATDRFFWCSMEYVEGRSLAELLRSSQPMAPSMCLRIVGQVANALDAAHRLGVVHAGLTPANVLIDAAGDARVTDFWVPWVLEQLGAFAADTDMTRKLAYRAPEQIAEGLAGPAADQYALPVPRRRWVPMGVLGLVVVGGAVATAWVLSSGATTNDAATTPVAPPVVRDSAVRAVSPQLPPLPPPVLPERRDPVVRPVPRPR